jgi:hypothetical protein
MKQKSYFLHLLYNWGIAETAFLLFILHFLHGIIPYIKSLKKLTSDVNYTLQAAVKTRLNRFVDAIIKEAVNA